jgi:hypothetical protein
MPLQPRDELLRQDRKALTRDEKRFADSGVAPERIDEIQALLNSATPAEKQTEGYRALLDLWQLWNSDRDEIDRLDVIEAQRSPPPAPSRFFGKPKP